MKINFIPFKAWHLRAIRERSETQEVWIARKNALVLESYPSMTMLVDGVIKACGGCVYLWPNTGEIWMVTAEDISKYKKTFYKFCLSFIDDVPRALGLKRLQCNVQDDFEIGHRWIEFFGFQYECTMRKYIEDKDYRLYSRIMEEKDVKCSE